MARTDGNLLLTDILQTTNQTLIIDGALATELENLGADLNDSLWSCKTLIEQPSLIKDVHLAYFKAGADIAITASYQASLKGLAEQRGMSLAEFKDLIKLSVKLAQEARDEYLSDPAVERRPLFVAGSVGPYGACLADGSEYRGDYSISQQDMQAFHRPRIEALVDAGVDLLAIETIPSFTELQALVLLLRDEFPKVTAWVGCTLRDGHSISDGTSLHKVTELLDACPQVIAIGVNCVPPELVVSALMAMSQYTKKALMCYPNSGETWNAQVKAWSNDKVHSSGHWQDSVHEWQKAGARLIGGCCRTGPRDVQAIRQACCNDEGT